MIDYRPTWVCDYADCTAAPEVKQVRSEGPPEGWYFVTHGLVTYEYCSRADVQLVFAAEE